jgi:hypothetical protein
MQNAAEALLPIKHFKNTGQRQSAASRQATKT